MTLLQLQFHCRKMYRVVITHDQLINWSDNLSPLYYHQNRSRSTSLLNVYTSMNIEECRTVKGNETSVGSHLASKVDKHLLTWQLNVQYH